MKDWLIKKSHILITVIFAIISFLGWILTSSEIKWSDLFVNLLSGFIASILTSIVIERLLNLQRARDLKPLQLALLRDVNQLKNNIVSLWSEMYVQSIVLRKEIPIEVLFTKETVKDIYDHLDLEGKPNMVQIQNWFQYIEYNYNGIQKIGDKILDRYNTIAPPEILQTIHYLINDSVFAGRWLHMICAIREMDLKDNFPRFPMLSCYTMFPQEKDFSEMHNLLRWCKEYSMLITNNKKEESPELVNIINPHKKPTSVLSIQKINNSAYIKTKVHVGTGKPPTEVPVNPIVQKRE